MSDVRPCTIRMSFETKEGRDMWWAHIELDGELVCAAGGWDDGNTYAAALADAMRKLDRLITSATAAAAGVITVLGPEDEPDPAEGKTPPEEAPDIKLLNEMPF